MPNNRLAELYHRYGAVIYMRCRAILTDPSDAEDATQETFLRVHRQLERVPGDDEALYWIYRVATNHCLSELRSRKRRPLPVEELPEPALAETGEIEGRLADQELAAHLIRNAHEKVRPVAWLYHIDGFEQQEVARILDISLRTVVNRLTTFTESARRFVRRVQT